MENEMSTTLEYFKHLQAENSSFYSTIKLLDYSRVSHIFMVGGRSQLAYENFGDVVSFDTTYMTNKCGLTFAPFVRTMGMFVCMIWSLEILRRDASSAFQKVTFVL